MAAWCTGLPQLTPPMLRLSWTQPPRAHHRVARSPLRDQSGLQTPTASGAVRASRPTWRAKCCQLCPRHPQPPCPHPPLPANECWSRSVRVHAAAPTGPPDRCWRQRTLPGQGCRGQLLSTRSSGRHTCRPAACAGAADARSSPWPPRHLHSPPRPHRRAGLHRAARRPSAPLRRWSSPAHAPLPAWT